MSGIETALGVYGLITGTITIIETSIKIYDAVKDKSGIPEKLRKVSETLPSLKELLKGAEAQFSKSQPADTAWIEVGKDVQRCNEACQELQDLLSKAYPEEEASRARRFVKAATTTLSGKGKTAEQLLKEIQGYLEVLLDRQILTNAALLEDIKATVDELLPRQGQVQNNVNGDNIGRDKISYTSSGSGHMFTGDHGTFHIGVPGGRRADIDGLPDDLNEDLRIQRLQDWLGFAEINDRECDIQEAHKATFRWALQLRQNPDDTTKDSRLNLAKWLRDSDGLFWIQGKLGSGKSTLMKYVWQSPLLDDYLRTWASGKPLYRAAFFFTKKGTSELQKSLQGLYRTLLAHLIRSNAGLIRIAFPHWRLRDAGHEPTIGVLRSALVRILEHATLSRKYCFFIDGLDEYEEANPKLQAELARDILNLADLSGVKIVAASRPEASFVGRFDGRPTLRLQDITQNDIENYVTAELGRTGSAVSRSLTHGQILRLADQVVLKAEGVFLWVVLVVADLIVGIDNVESYSELYDRLDSLDHDLYALFKQILLERIAPNHRQQIARHLLICSYSQKMNSSNQVAVHAIGHQVQAGLTGSQPDIYDAENTRQRILDLIMQLPVRSRGLCSVSDSRVEADVSVSLIHSSMSEFLADPDIRKILKDQAGDFETGLAVRIGLMARLVVAIDELRDDADGLERETLHLLLDIMHSLEIGRYVSGVIPLRSLTCLKELLEKPWQGYPFPTLDSLTWPWTLPAIGNKLPELKTRAGLLEYATSEGFTYYLQHHLDLNHSIPHTNDGCPLLFYAVSEESMAAQIFYDDTTSTTTQRTKPFELLLQQGADPNETYEGRSPWGELLRRFRNVWRDYDSSNRQWEIAPDILRGGLNAARHMLRHGADPSFGEVEIDSTTTGSADPDPDRDDVVSTRIFEDLLAVNCCRSTPLADCSCDVARLFRPQFVELAELVERKKVEKRLGLLVHLGWLGEHVARMFAVSYYAWAGLIALLAGLLLVLFV